MTVRTACRSETIAAEGTSRAEQSTPADGPVSPGVRPAHPGSRTVGRIGVVLGVLVLVGLHSLLVWMRPAADPALGYSRDLSLSIDGHWYLAEARASVAGRVAEVDGHYQKWWVTQPATAIFRVFGVGLASSRGLSFVASVGTVLLLFGLLRKRFGSGVALAGASLLAFDPTWLVFVRSPVIYPWVSFWILAVLAIGGARGGRGWAVGLALAGSAALGLKAIVLLAAPALLVEGWRRAGRSRLERVRWPLAVAASLIAAALVGPWSLPTFWRQVANYVTGPEAAPLARLLEFETRSSLFSAVPILVLAALGSLLFLLGAGPARSGPRAAERVLHVTLWSTLPVFAFSAYTPLRYLIYCLPIAVYLAVSATLSLIYVGQCSRRRAVDRAEGFGVLRLAGHSPRVRTRVWLAIGCGCVAAVYLGQQWVAALRISPIPFTGLALACVLGAAAAAVGLGRSAGLGSRAQPRVALVCLAAMLVPASLRIGSTLDDPRYTLRRANLELAAVVPANARVGGPFAHALTVENGREAIQMSSLHYGGGKLRDRVLALGCTHIAFDEPADNPLPAIFAHEGLPLEFLVRLAVRGTPVVVYRIRDAELARCDFEEGVAALAHDPAAAIAHFRSAARDFPDSASVWYRLGDATLRTGDAGSARTFLLRAIECDPEYVDAHTSLARLYRTVGYEEGASLHDAAARSALLGEPRL